MNDIGDEIDKVDRLMLLMLRTRPQGVAASAASLRVGVPMRSIVKSFRKLRRLKLVRERDAMLFLTKQGRKWILENQSEFAFSGEKSWRRVPEDFLRPPLRPFTPYAPLRSKMPKTPFKVEQSD